MSDVMVRYLAIAVGITFLHVGSVRADLAGTASAVDYSAAHFVPQSQVVSPSATSADHGCESGVPSLHSGWTVRMPADGMLSGSLSQLPQFADEQPIDGDSERALKALPVGPSSLSLFLSGLLTLGAVHGVRTSKPLHLAHLPDWYHTGGPTQIGHATPLEMNVISLAVCVFEVPSCHPERTRSHWLSGERHSPLADQHFPPNRIPRGPPLCQF